MTLSLNIRYYQVRTNINWFMTLYLSAYFFTIIDISFQLKPFSIQSLETVNSALLIQTTTYESLIGKDSLAANVNTRLWSTGVAARPMFLQ